MAENPSKYRVQFDFAEEAYRELNELQEKLQVPTKAEVVRYAIRTLQWVVSEVEEGKAIFVEDDGNLREVVFPFVAPGATARKKVASSDRALVTR